MMANIIKHKLLDKNLNVSELARLINTSPQNLNQKLQRDNFSEKEMREIAKVLNCDLHISLSDKYPIRHN